MTQITNFKLILCIMTIGLQGLSMKMAQADEADKSWARFSNDGSQIVVNAAGFSEFKAVSTVVFNSDGKNHRIGTKGYKLLGKVRHSEGITPFGEAIVSQAIYGKDGSPYQYTVTLKQLKNLKAFTLQGVFHNYSDQDVKLNAFDLLDTRKGPGGSMKVEKPAEWLVTPLMQDADAVSLAVAKDRYKEAAMLYRPNGDGFLVGPVGPAEAYTSVQFTGQALIAAVSMDGVLVRAGESRRSEEIIFSFEPSSTSTDIWTRWVAATHGTRQHRGPVYGWCSWYDRTTKIDAAHVLAVTKTIESNPNTFGKGIIQIDDGYQKMDGDWSANKKFPNGMAAVAKEIRKSGNIPGVWFAPLMINPEHPWAKANPEALQRNAKGIDSFMNANAFHPAGAKWVNPDHPKTKKFLYNIIKDARDRGFGYIKIDFNGIGSRFVDPTKTRMQVFRDLYALYRDAAGEEMYILSCLGSPTRGVVGFIDAARVGPDSHPAHFDKCLKSVLRFQIFDNVWWQNDADVAYIGQTLKSRNLGPVRQGEGMWRTWHSTVCLVGGTAMTSEPLNSPDAKALWRNFEIMRPGSREPAKLLTLGQSPHNEILGFAAQRPYGNFAVYNLYNSTDKPMAVTLDFKTAGLPLDVNCAVFDFWENKLIGFAKNTYTTPALAPLSSSHLRFTPLHGEQPILIGSNLHLSIGATEINNIRVSKSTVTLDLSDAGAQDGSLTFYSKKALKALGAKNCKVVSIKNLGENIWQVNVTGRLWGKAQSIQLKIQ
mgnify:CR=1 FL=1